MGVALTGSHPKRVTFPVTTRADLVNGIQSALLATGWTLDSTVTGGYVLKGTSPQSLWVKLKVWDNGAVQGPALQASLQFSSTGGAGIERHLIAAAGYTYSVWSNSCSVFISRPGVRHDYYGSVVVGGVPYVFTDDLPGVTEAWYSFGDNYGTIFVEGGTPRVRLLQFNNLTNNSVDSTMFAGRYNEAMWNGSYCQTSQAYGDATGNTNMWAGVPEILTLQEADDCERASYDDQTLLDKKLVVLGGIPSILSNMAELYDPLVAWGTTITTRAVIRGQVYDSIVTSRSIYGDMNESAEPVISLPPTATYHWRNFTDQYYWGALWLLEPMAQPIGSNIAY